MVVCVAQLVVALITAHGLLSFLSDVYGLFDPSGKTLWLSVDHRRLRPVDDMVLSGCMVGAVRAQRTLLESSQCLVSETEDRKQEDFHVEEALRACGYPKWTFNKVRRQIESKTDKKTRKQRDSSQWPMVIIP